MDSECRPSFRVMNNVSSILDILLDNIEIVTLKINVLEESERLLVGFVFASRRSP